MIGPDVYGTSPAPLRERARLAFEGGHRRTCSCPFHVGVRLECHGRLECGACGALIVAVPTEGQR